MLTKNQFKVLSAVRRGASSPQAASGATGLPPEAARALWDELAGDGLIDRTGGGLTPDGERALDPYRVENAVILAAGLSQRFVPISYERPKGLLRVHGEVLIERQIRQLREAGIADITVVVGYKKEYFFYLEDAFGVQIVVNDEYASRNNHSSLMLVREKLGNTYVCSSDDYFTRNPFESHVYEAYYAAVFAEGDTPEWCLTTGEGGRITHVGVGGRDSYIMLGHVYFDRAFSKQMKGILEREYHLPQTVDKLWENLYIDHIDEMRMVMRPYEPGVIYEFDSLDELRAFDPQFIVNVDSEVLDNIVRVLGCERGDIHDFHPIKQGITNLSCRFTVDGERYVYRHPGMGTDQLIDRRFEEQANGIAHELGLDDTFIFEDAERGWKVSRYLDGCHVLDVDDERELAKAVAILRRLHGSGAVIDHSFDFYDEGVGYCALLGEERCASVPGFMEMRRQVDALHEAYRADCAPRVLCHNDFFHLNLLVDRDGTLSLIDWEYAGMADCTQDFGTFVVSSDLSPERAERVLELYYGRKPTLEERRHNLASVGFAGWCWYVWSLFREAQGDYVGEPLYLYYRYAKEYIPKAGELYGLR